MAWALKQELKEQLAAEEGYYRYPLGTRLPVALAYPNSYFVGMSNLGLHIIYDLLNKRSDTACERVFLPERRSIERYEHTRTPLMSVENQLPLQQFAMIAFVLSFEMDYFNVVKMLELGKVRVRAAERGDMDPLIIAGGPCATFNPEPLSAVIDAFVIGEGEVVMPQLMDVFYQARHEGVSRQEMLQRLARVPGVYVPSLYDHSYGKDGRLLAIAPQEGAPAKVSRQWLQNLDAHPAHTVV